jgi:hypothetical protein
MHDSTTTVTVGWTFMRSIRWRSAPTSCARSGRCLYEAVERALAPLAGGVLLLRGGPDRVRSAGASLRRAPMDDGAAPLARRLERAHCPQAVGHLLGEPALDPRRLRQLGGVEELG